MMRFGLDTAGRVFFSLVDMLNMPMVAEVLLRTHDDSSLCRTGRYWDISQMSHV